MTASPRAHVVSSDALVDAPVLDASGEELARLAYVMLDLDDGRVAYAVLAHGGVLGLGERLFVVPWQSLRLDAPNDCFVLDVARESFAATFPLEATDL